MSKPDLIRLIALHSTVTGFLSGGALGVLFTMGQKLPYILPYMSASGYDLDDLLIHTFKALLSEGLLFLNLLFGAVFGGILGLVGGLLLGAVTSRFFYPLVRVRLYRVIATTIAVVIAGGGAAIFGPLSFSSIPMTPISAVTIGFSSVLISLIAGWTAALAAQDIAQWYKQISADSSLKTSEFATAISPGFIGVALLAVFGDVAIKWLTCGSYRSGIVINCVPSPRLYTSVAAGFSATLPILLVSVLTYALLKRLFKRR
jgi:hypothetical protein